jgi:hypothetical protein
MPNSMDETHHTRVVVRVEELDANGDCIDVPSEQVLADFPDDQNEEYAGMQSDNFYNDVIKKCMGRV